MMFIKREKPRLLKPLYENPISPPGEGREENVPIPLSPFDEVCLDVNVATLHVFPPPNPPNSIIERGLRKALCEYRECAGRLVADDSGGLRRGRCILLNDEGMLMVEATCDSPLANSSLGRPEQPSPDFSELHPPIETSSPELAQVQLTRFACGSLVVGLTMRHVLTDGFAASRLLVAWGEATRNLPMQNTPDWRDRSGTFKPRNPPLYRFDHSRAEYIVSEFKKKMMNASSREGIVVHRAHFTADFLKKLKEKASTDCPYAKPYTTFECLVAHLWRTITKARSLSDPEQTTKIKIAVNGRGRLKNPPVPTNYFGNVVLWAWPESKASELISNPVGRTARLVHDAIAGIDEDYFRSFIDFSNSTEKMEGLVRRGDEKQTVMSPDLEVVSWLRFPFYDLDFGAGCPRWFLPSYFVLEGLLLLLPSFIATQEIDVYVGLLDKHVESFKDNCYVLD